MSEQPDIVAELDAWLSNSDTREVTAHLNAAMMRDTAQRARDALVAVRARLEIMRARAEAAENQLAELRATIIALKERP